MSLKSIIKKSKYFDSFNKRLNNLYERTEFVQNQLLKIQTGKKKEIKVKWSILTKISFLFSL